MAKTREYTDPSIYNTHHQNFKNAGQPTTQQGWIQRAKEVSDILAQDAASRDIENKSPRAEVALLKSAGLLRLLGPAKYGGGEQSWETGYKVIREVARGDGSLGMLLGYHLLWSTTANVVGTEEQQDSVQQVIIENNWFVGGAVNPRDSDLKITSEGEELVFNGFKNFNTGMHRQLLRWDDEANIWQVVWFLILRYWKVCWMVQKITSSRSSRLSSLASSSSITGTMLAFA